MQLSRDSVAGILCLALSLGLLYLTRALPHNALVPIGPDFYPRIVLVIMAVLSVLLIVSDVLEGRRRQREPAEAAVSAAPIEKRRNYRLVSATFAVFAVYVLLLPLAGFRLATFLFVVGLQVLLEMPKGWRGWMVTIAAGLATVIVTYLAFEVYLSVLLPRGHWTGF